jgi:two-component system phosphate regulon sensor histidine kinase PhoR
MFAAILLPLISWMLIAHERELVSDIIERKLIEQLRDDVDLVSTLVESSSEVPDPKLHDGQRRLTLIAADGRVLYDSAGNPQEMSNHNDRAEVQDARSRGYGVAKRRSDTLNRDFIYSAKRLPDGRVVRMSAPLTVEMGWTADLIGVFARTTGTLGVIILVLVGAYYLRNHTRALELEQVAQGFTAGNFSSRASLTNNTLLGRVGRSLNLLGERLHNTLGELQGQRSLLDGALGALTEGVACVDRLDRILYCNQSFRRLAADGKEMIGQPFYEFLPAVAPAESLAAIRSGKSAGPLSHEFAHQQRHLRVVVASGGADVAVLVLHDLTELKQLEDSRRNFMAAVSHEFKTPLTSILGFTETLLDGALQDKEHARSFVEKISRHADRLAHLVNDVLSLSRLEQGSWDLRIEQIDLTQFSRNLLDEFQAAAGEKDTELILEAPRTLTLAIDPELMRQLIGNLVSNAIRYNRPNGKVWLRLAEVDGGTQITVEDTGIGIPPEHQKRVFDRFYRIDAHRSRQTGGTGLGLSIVKQLCEVIGATITLHSDSNGTRFEVKLAKAGP